jgi:hypothetical protein
MPREQDASTGKDRKYFVDSSDNIVKDGDKDDNEEVMLWHLDDDSG